MRSAGKGVVFLVAGLALLSVSLLSMGMPSMAAAGHARTSPSTPPQHEDDAGSAGFAAIMQQHGIPGAQLVHAYPGASREYDHGLMRAGSGRPVTSQTLFQAASLSKVVAAYIALKLVDRGRLDLDTPLWDYWPSPRTRDNPQARGITARMVLNHTTGLKNWQISPSNPAIDDTPLETLFAPGARFSYSGEGFYLLQRTLEHITGLRWDALARAEVFVPFDMPSSRFMTDPDVAGRIASGHERDGSARPDRVLAWENTAWTLITNAHDYSNFVQQGLYRGVGLAPSTHALMLAQSSDADDPDMPVAADPFVAWGLGLGLQRESERTRVWHWGDNPGFKAFFLLDSQSGESVVLFTNSEKGTDTYKEVLRLFLGEGEYPAVDWARSQS